MLAKEEMDKYEFPKWPQMRVVGEPISQEQAWEVIRRTDGFFMGYDGNDKEFSRYWGKKLAHPEHNRAIGSRYSDQWEDFVQWRKNWGVLMLDYLHNSWLSCSYIGGPHGWCSPKGNLYYQDNIGKWPKPDEVLGEWTVVAEAFPFLELDAVIMSEEEGAEDTSPILRFHIEKGKVTVIDPATHGLGMVKYWHEAEGKDEIGMFIHLFSSSSSEHHPLAVQMLESYVTKFADKIKEFEEWINEMKKNENIHR